MMKFYYEKNNPGSEPVWVYEGIDELIDEIEDNQIYEIRDIVNKLFYGNAIYQGWRDILIYENGYENYDEWDGTEENYIESDICDPEEFWSVRE